MFVSSTACGGGSSSDSATSTSMSATPTNATATTTVDVVGEASPVDAPPTTQAAAMDPTTSAAPTGEVDEIDEADRQPIRMETPLAVGAYRTTSLVGPLLAIDVDLPVEGLLALNEEGALALGAGDFGERTLVTIFHLDNGNVVDPTIDPDLLLDPAYRDEVSQPSPPDILEWFGGRSGVTAGPVEDSEFGGVSARRRTISFGPFDGGEQCNLFDERVCHYLFGAPVTGLLLLQNVGDGIVVYELTVAGHRLVVLVDTTYDAATAASIADSVQFVVNPHPDAPDGSEPLPFAGPLDGGITYVHERSTGGLWFLEGTAGVDVTAGFLRDRFVRFEADGTQCGSITDASQGFWYGAELPPDGTELDGIKMDDDIGAALESSEALDIVDGPTEVTLGSADAVAYDVRPVGATDVVLASTSALALTGATTRVVLAPRVGSAGTDLVVVTLGTPCEALLDGLAFLPGSER